MAGVLIQSCTQVTSMWTKRVALSPDVRRGLCLPVTWFLRLGYAPGPACLERLVTSQSRRLTGGRAVTQDAVSLFEKAKRLVLGQFQVSAQPLRSRRLCGYVSWDGNRKTQRTERLRRDLKPEWTSTKRLPALTTFSRAAYYSGVQKLSVGSPPRENMLLQEVATTTHRTIGSPITAYWPVMIFFAVAIISKFVSKCNSVKLALYFYKNRVWNYLI